MTDTKRIELFKKIEVTKDDLLDICEQGYDFTEEEVEYLSTKLDQINELVITAFVEYDEQDYLVEAMDDILNTDFGISEGVIRRRYPDIFECYLDNWDEAETTQRLLNNIRLCDLVMARYEKYLEHSNHEDAMENAIDDVLGG